MGMLTDLLATHNRVQELEMKHVGEFNTHMVYNTRRDLWEFCGERKSTKTLKVIEVAHHLEGLLEHGLEHDVSRVERFINAKAGALL